MKINVDQMWGFFCGLAVCFTFIIIAFSSGFMRFNDGNLAWGSYLESGDYWVYPNYPDYEPLLVCPKDDIWNAGEIQ